MIRVYLDCDGVLADFDKKAMSLLGGKRPRDFENTEGEQALWDQLYRHADFFASLPPMKDALRLVAGVQQLGFYPTILTGIPKPEGGPGAVNAAEQKRAWVKTHIGDYPVITCRSKDKWTHMEKPGDVLIDDWHKYKPLWEKRGKFILHTSALDSLEQLQKYRDDVHWEWTNLRRL